jgi:hypothetical protein
MTVLSNEQRAISGHVIPHKGLSEWEGIIEEWFLLIDRFCRITKGDAPYWYTERANIGLLAGACWRAGFIALEEFQYEKGYPNKPKWNGRVDLWCENEKTSTLVEAKMKVISLNSKGVSNTLESILDIACKDAKKSKGGQGDLTALGMIFVPVYIPVKHKNGVDQKISAMVKEIKQEFKGDMIFWHFPSVSRELIGKSEKSYWPGLFVIARKV